MGRPLGQAAGSPGCFLPGLRCCQEGKLFQSWHPALQSPGGPTKFPGRLGPGSVLAGARYQSSPKGLVRPGVKGTPGGAGGDAARLPPGCQAQPALDETRGQFSGTQAQFSTLQSLMKDRLSSVIYQGFRGNQTDLCSLNLHPFPSSIVLRTLQKRLASLSTP